MTTTNKLECVARLEQLGIERSDALALRRISMTLHRWHELECGDGNDYASWTIARGRKVNGSFEHDENDLDPLRPGRSSRRFPLYPAAR
jgi:hypothetical protein